MSEFLSDRSPSDQRKLVHLAQHRAALKREAIRLFRPQEHQRPLFLSQASEVLCKGGNRCSTWDTTVRMHNGEVRLIDSVEVGDWVAGVCETSHRVIQTEVVAKETWRETPWLLYTSEGRKTRGTKDHPVLVKTISDEPQWVELQDVRPDEHYVKVVYQTESGDWVDEWDLVAGVEREEREDDIVSLTTSEATYIADDIASHNSGKSVCTAMLFASAAMGIPILDIDGAEVPLYEPHAKAAASGRPMIMWCIGYGESHISQTFYRLLFLPGLFKVIRDKDTNAWRSFDPIKDKGREEEAEPSPPAIPQRFIQNIAWTKKAVRQFECVTLKNGNKIYAFTSKAEPKMGDPVDFIWIDERIMYESHYPEWQARLSDTDGRIVWSVYPGNGNDAVRNLFERAKDQEGRPDPDVEQLNLRYDANKYIPDDVKRKRIEGWSEDERKLRNEGEFLTGSLKMWDSFDKYDHRIAESDGDLVDELVRRNGGIPDDWMLTMILDPGTTSPGMLMIATPPPAVWHEVGGRVDVVCNEHVANNVDAYGLVAGAKPKMRNRVYQQFVIDYRGGRQQGLGYGKTVRSLYRDAMKQNGLRCVSTQHDFLFASDDLLGGLEAVRDLLRRLPSGRPKLRYTPNCTNFANQVENYQRETDKEGNPGERPRGRQKDCLCDGLRYFAMGNYKYVAPPTSVVALSPAWQEFNAYWRKKPSQTDRLISCGGQ